MVYSTLRRSREHDWRRSFSELGFMRFWDVSPYASDIWYNPGSVKVGYEISFTRYFYGPQPLRAPHAIWTDIRALELEATGRLEEIRGRA